MRLTLPLSVKFLPLLLLGVLLPQLVFAQTVRTDEYIYIGVEAEDHTRKNERWVTTTPTTPAVENDPDGNHSDQASGSTYLELLPDVRVTHEDTFGPPTAYWGRGGQGPDADYEVNFPEPGRYYVHVRAYSTGTEDNGLHVGIDGTWPDSGQRMQFCSASRRAWWWGSAQRDAGGNGSCGVEKTIWLDVDSAGIHKVSISAREDGFEIDRFALIKDLSENTRICSPQNISDVSCRNGSIENADGFVDLRVRLFAEAVGADPDVEPPNPVEVNEGSNITLTAKIENLDGFDTATDIVLTLSPVVGDWQIMAMDNRCIQEGDVFKCNLNQLHPTAPDENEPFVFTMRATNDGNLRIDASVFGAEADDTPGNDVAATIVKVIPGEPSDLKLVMNTDKSSYETGESVELNAVITNVSQITANNVNFNLSVPAGLEIEAASLPAACSSGTQIVCSFDSINPAGNATINMELLVLAAGAHTLNGQVQASNDENETNNTESVSVTSTQPEVETTTEGSVDSGEATDGGSDGNTGPAATDGGDATTGGVDTSAGSTNGETTATSGDTTGDGTTAGASDGTTGGVTDGATDGVTGSATDGTAGSVTDGMTDSTTDGTSEGMSEGMTDGATDTTTVATTSGNQTLEDDDAGAINHWLLLLLAILFSTRFYGRHKRKGVTLR